MNELQKRALENQCTQEAPLLTYTHNDLAALLRIAQLIAEHGTLSFNLHCGLRNALEKFGVNL